MDNSISGIIRQIEECRSELEDQKIKFRCLCSLLVTDKVITVEELSANYQGELERRRVIRYASRPSEPAEA